MKFTLGQEKCIVEVKEGALGEIGSRAAADMPAVDRRQFVLVTDETVHHLYGKLVEASFDQHNLHLHKFAIAPGESSKRLTTAGALYQFLADHQIHRDAVILALGGGVVSDLAGFVAATWMRGVDFVICPTTLEACVDAAIGGKTAVNIPGGKNLVGAFHQPRLVVIDPAVLATLPARDLSAGLAESIKHALLFSEEFLAWHEENSSPILTVVSSYMTELIEKNVQLKAAIVERDVRERSGDRMLLNYGHTLGHAIEECCKFTLRHGECVALGMVAACRIAEEIGLGSRDLTARVRAIVECFGLPTHLEQPIPWTRIQGAIGRDKKARGDAINWILLEGVGRPVIRKDIPQGAVKVAYESLFSSS